MVSLMVLRLSLLLQAIPAATSGADGAVQPLAEVGPPGHAAGSHVGRRSDAASYAAVLTHELNTPQFSVATMSATGTVLSSVPLERTCGSALPGTLAVQAGGSTALIAGLSDDGACVLCEVDLATGKALVSAKVKNIVVEAAVFDASTNTTFVAGFDMGGGDARQPPHRPKGANHIYTWAAGSLDSWVSLPGITVDIGTAVIGAGHMWLLARDDDAPSGSSLLQVDLQKRRLISNTPLIDLTTMLMWKPDSENLLAWGATETEAGVLAELNATAGTFGTRFYQSRQLSANDMSGASSVFDGRTGMVHSILVNDSTGVGVPYSCDVSLRTGEATVELSKNFGLAMDLMQ